MNKFESTIKKICEKTGDDVLHVSRMIFSLSPQEDKTWLLGWLKSKEVLIAVFGEEDTCSLCGGNEPEGITINTDYGTGIEHDAICKKCGATWIDKAEFSEEGFVIPAYEWHHNQMKFTLDEVMKYYSDYLGREE